MGADRGDESMLIADTILFDLFGTVVHFSSRAPIGGTPRRSTLEWLREPVARILPEIEFSRFLEAVATTTIDIIANRPPDYLEVTSAERINRALLRLGLARASAESIGIELSEVHMQHLASMTEVPLGTVDTLLVLKKRFRLGLVSNFDHHATAERILAMHGFSSIFGSITISAGFGRRKPHPSIFAHAMRTLGASPATTLFVGDSVEDDVEGSMRAGLQAVWLNTGGPSRHAELPRANHTIRSLRELPDLLLMH